jgi:hypothetical protein
MLSSDSEIEYDRGDEIIFDRMPVRPNLITSGFPRVVFIVSCLGGLWATGLTNLDAAPAFDDDQPHVIGAALCHWVLSSVADQPPAGSCPVMRSAADKACRRSQLMSGYLEYIWKFMIKFVQPVPLVAALQPLAFLQSHGLTEVVQIIPGGIHLGRSALGDVIHHWMDISGASSLQFASFHLDFAASLVTGRWPCLHCLQVNRQTQRVSFLWPHDPSKRILATFRNSVPSVPPEQPPVPSVPPDRKVDAELMIDWLDATNYIKDLKLADEASFAFGRLLARSGAASHEDLMSGLQTVCREVLRKARVRFDCVSMIISREFFSAMFAAMSRVDIYLYCDASPQWRGYELFAATYEVLSDGRFLRQLFPNVTLDRHRVSAANYVFNLFGKYHMSEAPAFYA